MDKDAQRNSNQIVHLQEQIRGLMSAIDGLTAIQKSTAEVLVKLQGRLEAITMRLSAVEDHLGA